MYRRRIIVFMALIGVGLLVVITRLGYLQIARGEHYRSEVEKLLYLPLELQNPRRGSMLDRTGKHILAMDKPCFDFALDYGLLTDDPRWIRRQKRRIVRTEGVTMREAERIFRGRLANTWNLAWRLGSEHEVDLERAIRAVVRRVTAIRRKVGKTVREEYRMHPVIGGLDEPISLDGTVGAGILRSHKRWYPHGDVGAHVIGLTGQVSDRDIEEFNDPQSKGDRMDEILRNYLPGDRIGKRGVERLCERVLRGKRGYHQRRMNGTAYETVRQVAAVGGRDVRIALDIELQRDLTELLRSTGYNGCIVVLSIPEGEVLSLVSVPVFDLNKYRTRRYYNSLLADTDLPLRHRAAAQRYPPGSTVKPIVALAALSEGKITPHTTIECKGLLDPNRPNSFRCWIYRQYGYGHGAIDLLEALKRSCNIYFYRVGGMLGVDLLSDWFGKFGFTGRPGTGLPYESRGYVYPKKRPVKADAWLMSIGQGPVIVTPLHVANAMATIARDGEFRSPRLVLDAEPEQTTWKLPIDKQDIDVVKLGMWKVVNESSGTAYKYARHANLGIDVCGKTGTADEPSKEGDIAWFVGFAPYQNPRIAFTVVLEYVQGGAARNAVPVAIEAIRLCQKYGYID